MRRVSAIVLALGLVLPAGALAANVLKGRTYKGKTSTSYFDHEGEHSGGTARPLTVKVSSSGRTVTVTLGGVAPLFYCPVGVSLASQSTKPATISRTGTFKATIDEKLSPEPDVPPVDVVTGRFYGRTVRGSVKTEAGTCSGSTAFTASVG